MWHEAEGYEFGAWVVVLPGKRKIFEATGTGIAEFNRLYQPERGHEPTGKDADHGYKLVDHAWEKFLALLDRPD